ncbi:MAG: response regulator [Chloroflexota bacterium]
MDGFEFMEMLKAQPNTQHIPIVVVSAWTSVKHREAALSAGASTFISKPYDLEILTKTVREYLPAESS